MGSARCGRIVRSSCASFYPATFWSRRRDGGGEEGEGATGEAAKPTKPPPRMIIPLELELPQKPKYKEEEEEEGEAVVDQEADLAIVRAKEKAEKALVMEAEGGVLEQAAADDKATRAAYRERVASWHEVLSDALIGFDDEMKTRRLRGMHTTITLPSIDNLGGGEEEDLVDSIASILLLLLGHRNQVAKEGAFVSLWRRTPSAEGTSLFWEGRWKGGGGGDGEGDGEGVSGKRRRSSATRQQEYIDSSEEDEVCDMQAQHRTAQHHSTAPQHPLTHTPHFPPSPPTHPNTSTGRGGG